VAWHTWAIRLGVLAGVLLLAGALYALAFSVAATPCSAHGSCDTASPNHPHKQVALWLAAGGVIVFVSTGVAAARWRML